MKISNKKSKSKYSALLLLFVLSVFSSLTLAFLGYIPLYLVALPLLGTLYFLFLGKGIFECDAEGEAINFRNYGLLASGKIKTDEFPKYKIVDYKISNFLGRRTSKIYLKSKTEKIVCLRYQTSFISGKDQQQLNLFIHHIIQDNIKKNVAAV